VQPFIDRSADGLRAGIQANYAPGSWGPESSRALLARDGRTWHDE
jgi:glucose-6-phosphate 1-dehydrogenase